MSNGKRSDRFKAGVWAGAACFSILLAAGLASAQTYSHVRIVRLSFVEGTVSVERPGSQQWAAASVNTPIEEGFKIATAADSFAEVEFENSSTARLGERSELDFTQLALASSGAKINRMAVAEGYATFNVIPGNDDVYEVSAAQATLAPSGNTLFRVDLNQNAERVEVFKGMVNVTSPSGSGQLVKNDVLELNPGAEQAFVVTQGITHDAWDEWVQKRQEVLAANYNRQRPSGLNPYPAYSSLYGWNDLSYFGDWNYLPGYGYGWSPYMSAGWAPYSLGQWTWYPTFGWTWISYEPWGWLPFHYGNWQLLSGYGWCWFPGNFNAWSPALVTWYQGNGWVGWSPGMTATNGTQSSSCPAGQNCTIAISANTFRTGKPINPRDILRVNPQQGRMVASPDIMPTEAARLAGPAVNATTLATASGSTGTVTTSPASNVRIYNGARSTAHLTSGRGNILVVGSRAAVRAPSVVLPAAAGFAANAPATARSGIVFDPESRRFVNNPSRAPLLLNGATGTMEAGRGSIKTESAPSRMLVAPATTESRAGTNLSTHSGTQMTGAPAPKSGHRFFGLWGGNRSPQSQSRTGMESGIGGHGNAPSMSHEMTIGRPMSQPRSQPSFSRPAPSPSFGRESGPSFGGQRMGGGGPVGGIRMESGGGGAPHAASPPPNRPH